MKSSIAAITGILLATAPMSLAAVAQESGPAVYRSQLPAEIIFSGTPPANGGNNETPPVNPLEVSVDLSMPASLQIGTFFTTQLSAVGGTPPYTFSFSGPPPAGWAISGGTLAGIAGAFGELDFDIVARDSAMVPQSKAIGFATQVIDETPLAAVFDERVYLPGANINQPAPPVSGNDGNVSFAIHDGSLPDGLSISNSGVISGTVSGAAGSAGNAVVRISDSYSHLDVAFDWTISSPTAANTVPVGALFKIGTWQVLGDYAALRDGNPNIAVVNLPATNHLVLDLGSSVEGNYIRVAGNKAFSFRVITSDNYVSLSSWGTTVSAAAGEVKTIDLGYPTRTHRYVGIQVISATDGMVGITELRYGMGGVLP